jgi:hypothetical protein
MSAAHLFRTSTGCLLAALFIAAAVVAACSPGTLPGSPSPLAIGGGGGRYNGTIVTRRVAGPYVLTETAQTLDLSMVLRDSAQLTGRFTAGESAGTLQGVLSGNLAAGTFQATVLISTTARPTAGGTSACEGRGDITVTLSGRTLSWTGGAVTYPNCPGLTVSSEATALAVSPIPGPGGNRANVVITIVGGPSVSRSSCSGGTAGFPFTVEMTESAGIDVTFDSTFTVEERRNFGALSTSTLDMPFSELEGGERRTYGACSPVPGTYQAFFSGTDESGNRIRVASPLVTMN